MITVEISKDSIVTNGHASELICNSVSVLMWALSISLMKNDAYDLVVKEDDGYEQISFTPTEKTSPIFTGIAECFKALGEQFPDEVKIFYKIKNF